jgi:hypothetical protein
VVLLEKLQGAEGLDAVGVSGSVCELAGGTGVLVDGNGGVGGMGRIGSGSRMIVSLERESISSRGS